MFDWKVNKLLVYLIKDKLGFKIFSSQGNPSVNPSIWFKGKERDECVIVGSAKFGDAMPEIPSNIDNIVKSVSCDLVLGH